MTDTNQLRIQEIILELEAEFNRRGKVVTAAQKWSAGRIRSTDLLEVVGEYEKLSNEAENIPAFSG